jgi:hypothetical protein
MLPPPMYMLGKHAQPASRRLFIFHTALYVWVEQARRSRLSHRLHRHTAGMLQESCRSITVFAKIIWSPPLAELMLCMILNT